MMENQMKEKNFDNVDDVVFALYDAHKSDYAQVYAEMNGIKDTNKVSDEDIYPLLVDDFSDKDFTDKEIEEITNRKMCNDTFYKLGAYMIALYNSADDYEEWKNVIKNDVEANLPDEEMKKLWEAYSEVDF